VSHMRQKRKERGRLEQEAAALADAAESAHVEVETVAEEAAAAADVEDVSVPEADAEGEREAIAEGEPELDAVVAEGEAAVVAEGEEEVVAEGEDEIAAEGDEVAGEAAVPTELEPAKFKALIEALIFASDKPVTVVRLKQLTRVKDAARVQATLDELVGDYKERGIALQSISGGYMFRTQSAYSGWVQQLIAGRPVRLSRAQLETLAIIAYRQPITRPEIDDIRGVDSGGTLKVLLDRSLIRILGKREEAGRPLLYGTTKEFLDFFSLADLRELPTLREYSELSEEHRRVVHDELGEEEPGPAPEASADASPDPSTPSVPDVAQDERGMDEPVAEEAAGVEDAPIADAPIEDVPIEDAPIEDAPVAEAVEEDAIDDEAVAGEDESAA
jgi:segregation and condensation protein B